MAVAEPSQDAVALAELSVKLKLTRKQRLFAEALALDPDHNQTKAALKAGYAQSSASVRAAEMIKMRSFKEYTAAFIAVAEKRALLSRPETGIEAAVMDEAELLWRLTMIGRSDIGSHLEIAEDGSFRVKLDRQKTGIVREVVTKEIMGGDEGKGAVLETRIKVADPLPALLGLAKIKGIEPEERPKDSGGARNNILVILGQLPEKKLDELLTLARSADA